jgi:hypothetical protein
MAFGDFTVTRASTKNILGSAGLYVSVANNVPAFEFNTDGTYRGLLGEFGATNLALNSRNLTTASWTATNVTTAQTATGADGVVNSATTLTASDANGTVLQAITSASAERVFSAVVRRRTGTGVVEITQDNGSTWTAITLTTSFQRVQTPSQSLTNPTVGFRIVTSGDAIDVDFTQAETSTIAPAQPSSPIITVASTVSRSLDDIVLTDASSLIGQTQGYVYAEFVKRLDKFTSTVVDIDGGSLVSGSLRIGSLSAQGIDKIGILRSTGTVAIETTLTQEVNKVVMNMVSTTSVKLIVNGVVIGTALIAETTAFSRITIGSRTGGTASYFNNHIKAIALGTTALTDAQAIALTTL